MNKNFSDKTTNSLSVPFVDNVFVFEGYFKAYIEDDNGKKLFFEKKNLIVNNARKVLAHLTGDESSGFTCINEFHIGGQDFSDDPARLTEYLDPNSPEVDDTDIKYIFKNTVGAPYSPCPMVIYGGTPLEETIHGRFIRTRQDYEGVTPLFVRSYPDSPNETSVKFDIRLLKSEANLFAQPCESGDSRGGPPTPYLSAGLFVKSSSTGERYLFASQTFPVMMKTYKTSFLFEWEIRY